MKKRGPNQTYQKLKGELQLQALPVGKTVIVSRDKIPFLLLQRYVTRVSKQLAREFEVRYVERGGDYKVTRIRDDGLYGEEDKIVEKMKEWEKFVRFTNVAFAEDLVHIIRRVEELQRDNIGLRRGILKSRVK
jgi:hypothetical protein